MLQKQQVANQKQTPPKEFEFGDDEIEVKYFDASAGVERRANGTPRTKKAMFQ